MSQDDTVAPCEEDEKMTNYNIKKTLTVWQAMLILEEEVLREMTHYHVDNSPDDALIKAERILKELGKFTGFHRKKYDLNNKVVQRIEVGYSTLFENPKLGIQVLLENCKQTLLFSMSLCHVDDGEPKPTVETTRLLDELTGHLKWQWEHGSYS